MGLQSFKLNTDFMNNLERPTLFIAKKDKTILASVADYDNLSMTFNLNAFQTATFDIYKMVDGQEQDYYQYFEEDMLVLFLGISWYKIHVETTFDAQGEKKSISATSLECVLASRRLIDFECNTGEILYDGYVNTIFYNPTVPDGSLLNRVLNVTNTWSVGHVDDSLASKQRSFDVDDQDVYSFLTQDVAEAFNCLFIFDTFNMTVNAYDLDTYGEDTNIFVSTENLAQEMKEDIEENSIYTCYRVNGGDGVYINEVNPNGTNRIYNFEYYIDQMSENLQQKVIAYNQAYNNSYDSYLDIMLRMQEYVDIIVELNTRLPSTTLDSTDWTEYGLSYLQIKIDAFSTVNATYCAMGYDSSSSLMYNSYKENLTLLNEVQAEYDVRAQEIADATEIYESIKAERDALQATLDMDNWFTVDEWKELDCYVSEATYTNDNYIVTDLEDDSERLEIERSLYSVAWDDLSEKCRPQYQYSSTLENLLTIPEFSDFIDYFELGNFIIAQTSYDVRLKLRLISYTVNWESTETISVTFSDAIRINDMYSDAASIQAQAVSAAMSFEFNKDAYDNSLDESNFVRDLRQNGLDVATVQIQNATNQSQLWNENGMTFRCYNDERQDYDPEQIKIINNLIVFSDDSFQSAKMALGKISVGNGEYAYGLNAEVLMGTFILGEYLHIENTSGTFQINNDGLSYTNGTTTINMNPSVSGEVFSIYKGSTKQMYIDSSGNVCFQGSITGGSISIGSNFSVTSSGVMTAKSGTFTGTISASTITGGTITIGSNFSVDSNGNMKSTNGTFTGAISASTIKGTTISSGSISIGSNFSVDTSGNMIAYNGVFTGKITATSGAIGGWTITDTQIKSSSTASFSTSTAYSATIVSGTSNAFWLTNVSGSPWIAATDSDGSTAFAIDRNGNITANRLIISQPDSEGARIRFANSYGEGRCVLNANGNFGLYHYESSTSGWWIIRENYTNKNVLLGEDTTGNINIGGNATGNVNIGNSSNTGMIHLLSVAENITAKSANMYINSGGKIWCSSSSSKRYKNVLEEVTDEDIEPLFSVPVNWFKYKTDYLSNKEDSRYDTPIPGFIVEDWNDIMPIVVDYNEDGLPEMWNDKIVVPLMFAMIKQNHQYIKQLEQRIDDLQK